LGCQGLRDLICTAASVHAGAGRPLVANSGRVPKMPVDESFPADPKIELSRCRLEDVEIGFARAGPPEGELIILLHGFPEYWGAWREYMIRLAQAGFLVVAPDQRGYGLSSKPAEVADYDLDRLAADVVGLARHLGRSTFGLVGHDWGGSVAWWLASLQPAALRRMVVINAPHPAVWREAMDGDWRQWVKSLYVRVMRLPRLPELMIRTQNYRALTRALEPAKLGPAELDRLREDWSRPGALTGMINWYRAFLTKRLPAASSFVIAVPTLIIWGDLDAYAGPELADRSARLCKSSRVLHVVDATHWVHHEQPDRVGALVEDFFSEAV
jgi:epoxide hydrolase 4